jgi:phenylpropionate dioxygenase-like ring-hydroxylating dioxygenase large terminal subunit
MPLLPDPAIAGRILAHIDAATTDLAPAPWREPATNYQSPARLDAEIHHVMRRTPTPFCPSAALPAPGAYIAREAAGTPLVVVRGADGVVRAFRNACRHRGTQVACGSGTEKAFVCRYHGWTYGLDGALRHVPHEEGFPGLDKSSHGLAPVHAVERGGLVWVTQDSPPGDADAPAPPDLPEIFTPDLQLLSVGDQATAANWKIVAEGFLEGYHIFSTHRGTFFPVQYDNLNVVEYFGRNSRITFPYRNIEKLRGVAPADRRVAGRLTYVYHLFPNALIATFPQRTLLIVLEPTGIASTRTLTYNLAPAARLADDKAAVERDADFVNQGAREDREVVESIQAGLAAQANDHFEFGLFEGAIAHFHRGLHDALGEA